MVADDRHPEGQPVDARADLDRPPTPVLEHLRLHLVRRDPVTRPDGPPTSPGPDPTPPTAEPAARRPSRRRPPPARHTHPRPCARRRRRQLTGQHQVPPPREPLIQRRPQRGLPPRQPLRQAHLRHRHRIHEPHRMHPLPRTRRVQRRLDPSPPRRRALRTQPRDAAAEPPPAHPSSYRTSVRTASVRPRVFTYSRTRFEPVQYPLRRALIARASPSTGRPPVGNPAREKRCQAGSESSVMPSPELPAGSSGLRRDATPGAG